MAEVVHTESEGGNAVAIVAILVIVGLAVAFFMYVLPTLRKPETPPPEGGNIQINLPPPSPEPSPEPAPSAQP
ncbi:MAG TPA: hypothetical protein VL283_00050 [Candidatus Baltobacteraceae bacterium]|nr:hypothetical protein [Candidatus Baltobacteraceae bacterium]